MEKLINMILRLIGLSTLICLGSLLHLGQTPTPSPVPENWQVLRPDKDEFEIETPLELRTGGDKNPKSSRKYFGSINGVYVYVFSDPAKKPSYFDFVARFVEGSGQTLAVGNAASKVIVVTFKDAFDYWHNVVARRTETRIYVAQTISKEKESRVAKRFLASFRMGPSHLPNVDENIIDAPESIPADTGSTGNVKPPGFGSGRSVLGSGSGSTGGIGSSATGVPDKKSEEIKTAALRILSKARPGYTDFARVYEIEGVVILRVTFLATGEIGAVTAVNTLPFGLTDQAMAAAKRIRFEPKIINGTPMTVVRQVEYTFSIY